jgi:hypothetical protein
MDARGIGERSDAVLRMAMPAHDDWNHFQCTNLYTDNLYTNLFVSFPIPEIDMRTSSPGLR